MLYLRRRKNESLYIKDNNTGAEIELVILDIFEEGKGPSRRKTVQLGFVDDAKRYTFLRKEVKQRVEDHPSPNPYYLDRMPIGYKPKSQEEINKRLKEVSDDDLEALGAIMTAPPVEQPEDFTVGEV